jgi:hypothetical protein
LAGILLLFLQNSTGQEYLGLDEDHGIGGKVIEIDRLSDQDVVAEEEDQL